MSEEKMKKVGNQAGVYCRESASKRFHGKVDKCFYITYKNRGRKIWEKIGWISERYSAQMAANIRAERMRSIRHGDDLPQQKPKVPMFKALAEQYLKWSADNKNRAGIEDTSRYENHLKERFENKYLDEISALDLEQMKTDMAKDDYAPKTIAHCIGLLRSMYNKAAEWKLYQGQNPGAQVKKPVIKNDRDRWLTFEEAEILLRELKRNPQIKKRYQELKDPKLHDMALLSLHTGARAGEIFKIKGSDINFETRLITLRDTKNAETRHCPMTEAVMKMLRRRMPSDLNSYVFTDREGGKIKEVSNAFDRVINRLKMNDGETDRRQRLLFHSLRHTFASWLAIQGTPLYTIAKLMGHKSISMSERYSHLSPDHKKDIVIGLERMFNSKSNGITISEETK